MRKQNSKKVMFDISKRLAPARTHEGQVDFQRNETPTTPVHAYQLQTQLLRLLGEASEACKVRSTSPEAQAKLGTDTPDAARIPEKFSFFLGAAILAFEPQEL